MAEKEKLSDKDWEVLFPHHPFKIGTKTINLTPLTLIQVNSFKHIVEKVYPQLEEAGVFTRGVEDPGQVIFIVGLVVEYGTSFISDVIGIDEEDVQKLPVKLVTELVAELVDLNLKDREVFEKNFKALGGVLEEMFPGDSEMSSNFLSPSDTPLEISETTPKAN